MQFFGKIILLLVLVFFAAVLLSAKNIFLKPVVRQPEVFPSELRLAVGRTTLTVEVAQTPAERAQGLSGRESLAADEGMLFVFPESASHPFWMAGMHFPLDIVWISENKKVVGLSENIPPPPSGTPAESCKLYYPPEPVKYVLEVNAGMPAG